MKRTMLIAGVLLLIVPGCGMLSGRYQLFGRNSTADVLLPAPKDLDQREWTEATLTSVQTGEQKVIALEPPLEPGGPQYVAGLEHGFWHVELTGEDRRTGESIHFSLENVAVNGDTIVLDIEPW